VAEKNNRNEFWKTRKTGGYKNAIIAPIKVKGASD